MPGPRGASPNSSMAFGIAQVKRNRNVAVRASAPCGCAENGSEAREKVPILGCGENGVALEWAVHRCRKRRPRVTASQLNRDDALARAPGSEFKCEVVEQR